MRWNGWGCCSRTRPYSASTSVPPPASTRSRAVGIAEAPRGVLIHHYKVDDKGAILWVNLIIATGHNNLAINKSIECASRHFVNGNQLKEGMLNRVSAVVRAYDPCLSCSTHAPRAHPDADRARRSGRARPGHPHQLTTRTGNRGRFPVLQVSMATHSKVSSAREGTLPRLPAPFGRVG